MVHEKRASRGSFSHQGAKSRKSNFGSLATKTREKRVFQADGHIHVEKEVFVDHEKMHQDKAFSHHKGKNSQREEHSSYKNRKEGRTPNFKKGKDGKDLGSQGNKHASRKNGAKSSANNIPGFSAFQLRLVSSILHTTIVEKKPLDKSYAYWFAKVKIPAVEQGFIIRHINAMFRRLSYFAHVASLKRPSDFERHVNRLILSYYANEGWPLPELNAEGFDRSGLAKRIQEAQEHPLLNEGCPYWLEELCSKELKEIWPAERKALGEAAKRFIRTNTLKVTREELASKLSSEGIVTRPVKGVRNALEVTSNAALFRSQCFKDGFFEQQDAGSQLIAPFLMVEAGQRVIDTCAGSGGKTLHLAALMQGKGSLIALDVESWKLEELKKRAKRAGAFNIETRAIESTKVIKRLYEVADRVLIDAPCSGLGVLRRTADSKWSDPRPRLIELKKIQADILERYSRMAKVGGYVVYSTCSILPSENQEQIKAFLQKHGDEFVLDEEQTILPSSGFDGFYMARLKRIAAINSTRTAAESDSEETTDKQDDTEQYAAQQDLSQTDNSQAQDALNATNAQETTTD